MSSVTFRTQVHRDNKISRTLVDPWRTSGEPDIRYKLTSAGEPDIRYLLTPDGDSDNRAGNSKDSWGIKISTKKKCFLEIFFTQILTLNVCLFVL